LLHLAPLIERESSRLFEQARRKSDLSNVMNETTKVCKLLISFGETQAARYVASVDRDSGGVARGVTIAGI
jgi:hypothetical protein